MASLFEKVQLLLSASLHDLVNKALRENSVAVLDEQIRRASRSLEELEQTIAQVTADKRIQEGKVKGLREAITSLDADAKALLSDGKEDQAALLVKQKLTKESALKKASEAISSMGDDLEKLQHAKRVLQNKIDDLRVARDNVETALRIAKSKNKVVETLDDLANVLEESGSAGIQDWVERVETTAEVRLDQTLEKHGDLLDPMSDASVAAELARMKGDLQPTS